LPLLELESEAGRQFSEKYLGHRYLSISAQSFFLETLRNLPTEKIESITKTYSFFPLVFVDFLMLYRRIRTASVLSNSGYMGPGYVLLRDVVDKTIHMSALFQGLVTYDQLMGIAADDNAKGTKEELRNKRRKKRIAVEKDLIERFSGGQSGLTPDDVHLLSVWKDLFDRETHGSHLSAARAMLAWATGDSLLAVVSPDDETLSAMYMNRFHEACWLYHRLLPNLQFDKMGFGDSWAERWQVLDESFWQMELGLAGMNKKIGDTFIKFTDVKFPFDPNTRLAIK
jgi:hypothetical protein